MSVSKGEKWRIIAWVDKQFATDANFPRSCSKSGSNAPSQEHFQAWKEWRLVPAKRRDLDLWLKQYLTSEDRQQLELYLTAALDDA